MPNDKPKMEGDVYYPSDEVLAQANVPDWDEMAQFRPERSGRLLGRARRGVGMVREVGQSAG